jgi:quercetin dioxygenase-like cupin family protein
MKSLVVTGFAVLFAISGEARSQSVPAAPLQLLINQDLGELPQVPIFWHLYNYPSRSAAEAVKEPRETVVEAFGKVWLYSITEADRHPAGGTHVADIGPLPLQPGRKYTARYMEATFTQGMKASVHRHSGPEAWYLVTGAQCLETPDGMKVLHAGESGIVPEGPPMALSSVGAEIRRSVLLVLHDTTQPWITRTDDWKPKGLCPE